MAKKPEWFSPNVTLNTSIKPGELDNWVNWLRKEVYETEKDTLSSVEDIRMEMSCWYNKYSDDKNKINGEITVLVISPSVGLKRVSAIHFSTGAATRNTIDRYGVFKGIKATDISYKEELLMTERRMQIN